MPPDFKLESEVAAVENNPMTIETDFIELMTQKMPAELRPLLVFPHPKVPSPAEVLDGVVFIHAIWSGPSVGAFRLLLSALSQLNCRVPILFFSADYVNYAAFTNKYGQNIVYGGWGETFIVHEGRVILEASSKTENYQKVVENATERAFSPFDCGRILTD